MDFDDPNLYVIKVQYGNEASYWKFSDNDIRSGWANRDGFPWATFEFDAAERVKKLAQEHHPNAEVSIVVYRVD